VPCAIHVHTQCTMLTTDTHTHTHTHARARIRHLHGPFATHSITERGVAPCSVVEVGDGASVSGLHFAYDWGGHTPFEMPPTIHLTGGEPRVTNVKMQGPWIGISSIGNANAGRFYIADVFIVDAHSVGIAMGASFDFSWLVNVEVWAPTSANAFINGTGILLNGIDGVMATNIGVFR
jgi:hypothetical protein